MATSCLSPRVRLIGISRCVRCGLCAASSSRTGAENVARRLCSCCLSFGVYFERAKTGTMMTCYDVEGRGADVLMSNRSRGLQLENRKLTSACCAVSYWSILYKCNFFRDLNLP